MPDLKGNKLHFSAWINWWAKAESLTFYNDEEEREERPKPPPRPRRSKYKPESEFLHEIEVWEAVKPKPLIVKPKGNSMSQKLFKSNASLLKDYLIPTTYKKTAILAMASEEKG
ncbi:MAG: hypothetical protein M1822_002280 [Bathelium mastoideum]|nr:MAG: hypothetical protein M1822_002280 [Bathelium mastoideum]